MDYGGFDEMSPGPAPPPSVLGWDDTTPGGSGPHLLPGSPPLPSPASNAAGPHSGPPSRGFRGGDAGQQGAQGQGKGRGAAGRGKAAAARDGRAKDAPGAVVWAKLARYPWWPAQARGVAHTQAAATRLSRTLLVEIRQHRAAQRLGQRGRACAWRQSAGLGQSPLASASTVVCGLWVSCHVPAATKRPPEEQGTTIPAGGSRRGCPPKVPV